MLIVAIQAGSNSSVIVRRAWRGLVVCAGELRLNHFRAKVESKAANTLGLCISISGFTPAAIAKQSERSPLLLMDGADLHAVLDRRISLTEVLERKRRYAVETGAPMYPVAAMLGG